MKLFTSCLLASALLASCSNANDEPINKAEIKTPTIKTTEPVTKVKLDLTPMQKHGAKIYKRCRACHTLDEGGKNKLGPNLWGIYGAKTASKEGYAYSKAMKAADIIWDEESMNAYLTKPSAFMPGNKMTFIGLKKQEDRDAVQAYIKLKTTP